MLGTDGQAAWDTFLKKPEKFNPLFLEEIVFRLSKLVFGTNMIRRNAYYFLRRLMQDYKVNAIRGVKEWQWRMNQLNDYIMLVPSQALDNRNALKQEILALDTRKILDMALPTVYWNKLFGIGWDI